MKKRIILIVVAVLLLAAGGIYLYFYLQPEPIEPPPEDPEAFTEFYRNEILAYIDSIIETTPEDSEDNYSLPAKSHGPVFDIHSVNSLKKIRSYVENGTRVEDMTYADTPDTDDFIIYILGKNTGCHTYFSFTDKKRERMIRLYFCDSDREEFLQYIFDSLEKAGIEHHYSLQ